FDPNSFSLIAHHNPTTPINGSFRFFNKNTRVMFYPDTTPSASAPFLATSSNYTLLLTSALQDDSLNPGPNSLNPAPVQVAFRTRAAWNTPSPASPYSETFSTNNMLDANSTNAIWNSAPSAQRLEGGYGAAALAGSGVDGAFNPTQNTILSTNPRPFGYQYTSVSIPQGVTITLVGTNPAILRAQGNFTMSTGSALVADGANGGNVANYNLPGGPGGAGGAGGNNGGAGNPSNVANYPWPSDSGMGASGGTGGTWTGQVWSTGNWPWAGNPNQDICGSGGGGGGSIPGIPGSGSNVNADGAGGPINSVGDPSQPTTFNMNMAGGSGGGGGGGTDDPAPGDQTLGFPFDDGGGGGGGGGGAILITSAQNCIINGTISANGGNGGSTVTLSNSYTGAGVGGGGGSGGCIYVQALNLNISGGTFRVTGGTGGIGGFAPWWTPPPPQNLYISQGGTGGDGYIRMESSSGTIIGQSSAIFQPTATQNPSCYSQGTLNINTTQGQSLFFDSRCEDPDYVDNASGGLNLNLVLNSGDIFVYIQGADTDSLGQPDPQTYWPNDNTNMNPTWEMIYDSTATTPTPNYSVPGINRVDRYRFIRFRVIFGNLLNVFPPGPFLTDITFPFKD
ncbi:MAG: hypothetical protein ACYS47_17380, partial [Planctomycetota bacterium]